MNIGRIKFTKFVLNVFQLLTLEELHCAIDKIMKQVTCQEGFTNTKGNHKDLYIRCAIHLFYEQPFNLFY
jgi:hypothetical protein